MNKVNVKQSSINQSVQLLRHFVWFSSNFLEFQLAFTFYSSTHLCVKSLYWAEGWFGFWFWKMASSSWNWELKVERLRQALEKQALERTYDLGESGSARSADFFSVDNISAVSAFWICWLATLSWIFVLIFSGFLNFSALSPWIHRE